LRRLLTPASWLYAAGWQAYLGLYRTGVRRSKEPHHPVLCIGNLTVGGSGKSPLTLHVYDLMRSMGREVVVSGSGYGSPAAQGAQMAPNGPLKASEWGDEAAMLRWFRPEMRLVIGRNRVLAADLVHREFPDSVLLLDDGFQHLPLKKHLSILIDEPTPPNSHCLPAGPYREPRGNRRRADLVLPSEFQIVWEFMGPFEAVTLEPVPKEAAAIQLLTAIARPERFVESLNALGFEVAQKSFLPDHDPLDAGNLLESVDPNVPLVVTAKDWIKLKDRADIGSFRIWVAWNEASIQPAHEFDQILHAALAKTP